MARIDAVGDVRHYGAAGYNRAASAAGLHDQRQVIRDQSVSRDLLLGHLPTDGSKAAIPSAVARRRLGATRFGELTGSVDTRTVGRKESAMREQEFGVLTDLSRSGWSAFIQE